MTAGRRSWPLFLYDSLILVSSPALAGYLLWRLLHGKSREGWSERWGRLPAAVAETGRPRIWFHAASVGEVMASLPVLRSLRQLRPDATFVMTTITPGGREVAEAQVGKLVDAVAYLPFDLPWLARRSVGIIQPDLFVGVETEIWPNLLGALRQRVVPTALVNARISDKSFPRYRRIRWLMSWALSCYDTILAQTVRDRSRLLALGAPEERVQVAGNVKFDQADEPLTPEQVSAMKAEFHIPPTAPVWVVGSTRTPEEERMVWTAHAMVRANLPDLVIVHAPRHVDRADAVLAGMREFGLHPVRRTLLRQQEGNAFAIVLDTFGELGRVYAMADVAFIGNSLVPPGGGQNLLQPLAQGKPVLYGPYMQNFRDVVAEAEECGVGFTVGDTRELAARLQSLLRDSSERERIAERALNLIRSNRGASERCAQELARLLTRSPEGEGKT